MTIGDILALVDELKPNQYSDEIKIMWISELDFNIFETLIKTHEDAAIEEFNGYTENDMSTEVIAPEAHKDIYTYYLFAMIDFMNGETDRYQNSSIMFNGAKQRYYDEYNRTHMPISKPLGVF